MRMPLFRGTGDLLPTAAGEITRDVGDTALGIPLSPCHGRSAIGVTLRSLRGGNIAGGDDMAVLRNIREDSWII